MRNESEAAIDLLDQAQQRYPEFRWYLTRTADGRLVLCGRDQLEKNEARLAIEEAALDSAVQALQSCLASSV